MLKDVLNLGMGLRQNQLNGSDTRSGNEILDIYKISKSNKGKDRRKTIPCKKINQYDINNNLIRKWNSITEASKVTGIGFNSISNNLTGRTKVSGGFKWKYNDEEN